MSLKRVKKWYWYLVTRIQRKQNIGRLKNSDYLPANKIAKEYEAQLNGIFEKDEKDEIEKIDRLRNDLLSSNEKIIIREIGGLKDKKDQKEEAYISVKDICKNAASPRKWAEFQYRLIRSFKPSHCLELGTNLGVSGCYSLSALKLNEQGSLVTLEGNPKLSELAAKNFEELKLNRFEIVVGLFNETLGDVLTKYKTFDYAFIDGHHDMEATILYFDMIKPFLANNAIVIFDDINWSNGMQKAWQTIITDKKVSAVFDFYKLGIIVYNAKAEKSKIQYRLSL